LQVTILIPLVFRGAAGEPEGRCLRAARLSLCFVSNCVAPGCSANSTMVNRIRQHDFGIFLQIVLMDAVIVNERINLSLSAAR
jgi:hypothetical protein